MRWTSGNLLETTVDAFGKHVVMYDGIPVITDDFVSDAQTQGAATTCSSSSAVRFGMRGGSDPRESGTARETEAPPVPRGVL